MLFATLTVLLLPGIQEATSLPEAQATLPGYRRLEVQANTYEDNRQVEPALAVDSGGRILATWGSRRQEQCTFGVFAQLLDPLGRPLTTEIHVNSFLPGEQARPSAAFAADDTAWIVWHSTGQDDTGVSLYGQRFRFVQDDADGPWRAQPLGTEFAVATEIAGDQDEAVIAAHPDGGLLVTWTAPNGDRGRLLRGRYFADDGSPLGDEFILPGAVAGSEARCPSLVPRAEDYLVVWSRTDGAGQPDAILGLTLARTPDAAAADSPASPFLITSAAEAFAVEPCVDAAADGSFVVAWMATQDGAAYEATYRRYAPDCRPLTPALGLDAGGEGWRAGATVAVAADGRFVVAYDAHPQKEFSSPGHRPKRPCDVRAQVFAADGQPSGAPFRFHRHADGEQTLQAGLNSRHLLWTDDDRLLATWHGQTGTDKRGVGLTLLVPEDFDVPAPASFAPLAAATEVTAAQVHGEYARPEYDPTFVPGPPGPPQSRIAGIGGFVGHVDTGWTPPDPDLAVGPNHVVTVVNGGISFHTKSGTTTFTDAIAGGGGFWGSVGAGGFVFDPVALWDPHSERFIVAAADGGSSGIDAICLAVSDDDDPNGSWHKYRFLVNTTCNFLDFPNLGVNDEAVFLAGDCFLGGGNRVFFWDKTPMLSGAPVTMRQIQTSGSTASLGATKNYDTNSPGYFASTYSGSSTRVRLRAITDPNGTPALHNFDLVVPFFTFPPDAHQLGTSNRASTIDYRIKNGVVRNGSLWICHNTGPSTARTRWYEVDLRGWPTSGQTPIMVQNGTLDFGNGQHNWFGDIHVSDNGDAVISFNRSSSQQYISIEYVKRSANDPLGTFSAPEQLQISTSPEQGSRWGDYGGVEQDPDRPSVFWSHYEYRTSGWRTWVGEFEARETFNLFSSGVQAGASVTLSASPLIHNERVHFVVALAPGSYCPPALGGLCLDVAPNAAYLGSDLVNQFGIGKLTLQVPPGAPVGQTAYIQAAVIRGPGGVDSIRSNRVDEVIQ